MLGVVSGILLGTAYLLVGQYISQLQDDGLGLAIATISTMFGALMLVISLTAGVMLL
jgi:hypothetical protein